MVKPVSKCERDTICKYSPRADSKCFAEITLPHLYPQSPLPDPAKCFEETGPHMYSGVFSEVACHGSNRIRRMSGLSKPGSLGPERFRVLYQTYWSKQPSKIGQVLLWVENGSVCGEGFRSGLMSSIYPIQVRIRCMSFPCSASAK